MPSNLVLNPLLHPLSVPVSVPAALYHPDVLPPKTTTGDCPSRWTAAPLRDGLPTPPNEMNGLAYSFMPSTTTTTNYGAKLTGTSSTVPYGKLPAYVNARSTVTPTTTTTSSSSSSSSTAYLQIPSSINDTKGSLAEFAAQMTCLFWFEKTTKLKAIEDRSHLALALVPEAFPTIGFQKWVTTILSTTQVSQNVILLALLFVYRLKKFNPGVKGKKGSEFRLMTIALMLGNKFLDDNTYTNKTWAEVSGISVQEIHVMEVEFLSNVRYNLFVSKEEWSAWHAKLGLFADYFTRASRVPLNDRRSPTAPPLQIPSASLLPPTRTQPVSPSSKLPSPPASAPLVAPSHWNMPFNNGVPPPYLPSEIAPPSINSYRKRSRDEYQMDEQPAKKIMMSNNHPTLPPSSSSSSAASTLGSIPTLPPVLAQNSLPTSLPSSHVPMASVVPRLPRPNPPPLPATTTVPHLPVPPPSAVPPTRPMTTAAAAAFTTPQATWTHPPVTSGLYSTPVSLPDPNRLNSSPFGVPSTTTSPAVSAYSVHTPQMHLSPSFFLANRNSPYRPVRAVNTLLIPPPSGSLLQQRSIPFDHMHYQPLGKTAERKTGLLPYVQDVWPTSGSGPVSALGSATAPGPVPGSAPQGQFLQPVFHNSPSYP
ncbi:hypothetical protein ASPZODRAFT_57861 [Penicilliopsis zonata CBS 506.65]|uniref:Cyclin N-terminal domain-containing protein n=1 Tax=Penicilliopsis zonata CBS 506.65 TaxID=1073090 RepID=A0A1L9SRJ5_9EURO|nr:hypothetical protein ASPZODRAFT_57861 [Penicilliopsis zonata CBS 506.65]OJJ49819.1 hypothetical protein ASPZODRAFT_57861 [Penicilliopsis zonata CBS 506.65]